MWWITYCNDKIVTTLNAYEKLNKCGARVWFQEENHTKIIMFPIDDANLLRVNSRVLDFLGNGYLLWISFLVFLFLLLFLFFLSSFFFFSSFIYLFFGVKSPFFFFFFFSYSYSSFLVYLFIIFIIYNILLSWKGYYFYIFLPCTLIFVGVITLLENSL